MLVVGLFTLVTVTECLVAKGWELGLVKLAI